MHCRALAGGFRTLQPRFQIDKHRAAKKAVLKCGITGDVWARDAELDELCMTAAADECVDEQRRVVTWLHMRRLWWIERGPVNDGAVERYGLDLSHIIEAAFSRKIA